MSDNSSGSSGSSSNSWTLLSPEEVALDAAGPVDDGTESVGDVASLSEEVTGSSFEVKPHDGEAPQETVLSEEGHQICQETSPEHFDDGAVSGPSAKSDPEICAPVIHATITTSPPDNDLLGAVPFSIATESSLFLLKEPFFEAPYEESLSGIQPTFDSSPKQCLVPGVVAEAVPEFVDTIGPGSEPVVEPGPGSEPVIELGPGSEAVVELGPGSEAVVELGPGSEPVVEFGLASEPVVEFGPGSEAVVELGPGSEPAAEIGPGSEPAAEIGPGSEPAAEIGPGSEPAIELGPASEALAEFVPGSEAVVELGPGSEPLAEIGPGSEPPAETSPSPEFSFSDVNSHPETSPGLSSEVKTSDSPYPETPASLLPEKELVTDGKEGKPSHVVRQTESPIEHEGEASGLRQRLVHYPKNLRQSSDEDDKEETEFKLPERKAVKPGVSINHLILGALALLCLGSLFFSDDFDGAALSDQELLEKLLEENKQISILEAQIQSQKEELDQALKAAAEKGLGDEERVRMREELAALPSLKAELESLKARVSELTQLTGAEPSAGFAGEGQSPANPDWKWFKKDELRRQKLLLEESKTRLNRMTKQKWLGERLVEMQQRLSDQVDRLGKKNGWRRNQKGGKSVRNDRGDSVQKQKEVLKKYRDEWEQKKADRKLERERRKQEKSWQARPGHKPKVHNHHESGIWKLQEKKLRKKQPLPAHCRDVSHCAETEDLVHVQLSEFQNLLDIYLNKLQGLSMENKEAFHYLIAQFFHGGIFSHDRMPFREFVEDVADILEDLAELLMDDDVLEEEMEEFEREVLWRFAV